MWNGVGSLHLIIIVTSSFVKSGNISLSAGVPGLTNATQATFITWKGPENVFANCTSEGAAAGTGAKMFYGGLDDQGDLVWPGKPVDKQSHVLMLFKRFLTVEIHDNNWKTGLLGQIAMHKTLL